jgi:ADP-ribosylglycohydrolase
MKTVKAKLGRRKNYIYTLWEETYIHDYIEDYWIWYSEKKSKMTFQEYVYSYHSHKSNESVIEAIRIWERVRCQPKKTENQPMLLSGAIAGDIIGSAYEMRRIKKTDFPLFSDKSHFTDDSVMTVAVASKLLDFHGSYTKEMQDFGRRYPHAGYGSDFMKWLFSDNPQPYGSYGNGSAMRVSPVSYTLSHLYEVWYEAEKSAEITHNHSEGIKGAKAVATAVFLARTGSSKEEIKNYIEHTFNYDLSRTIDEIRVNYHLDISCQGSVPEAMISFLESTDFESSIRNAISIGGDSDTIASISGAIAEAFYKEIPENIIHEVVKRIPDEFLQVLIKFTKKYQSHYHINIDLSDEEGTYKHKLYNNITWTKYWIKHFKENNEFGNLRFKVLIKEPHSRFLPYPRFDFDETLIDVVDLITFMKKEETRIPLFIGSSLCGICPYLDDFPDFFIEDKIIGVLGKNILSGSCYGLGIYKILAGTRLSIDNELMFFKNEKW